MLVVPELARGKIVQCSKCKRLAKVPLVPPAKMPHHFGGKRITAVPLPPLAASMTHGTT
jgi:hypothetical protein